MNTENKVSTGEGHLGHRAVDFIEVELTPEQKQVFEETAIQNSMAIEYLSKKSRD